MLRERAIWAARTISRARPLRLLASLEKTRALSAAIGVSYCVYTEGSFSQRHAH